MWGYHKFILFFLFLYEILFPRCGYQPDQMMAK